MNKETPVGGNRPVRLLSIDSRIAHLRDVILEDKLYAFLDLGAEAVIEFCGEAFSIWCEAKADPDTLSDLLLDMRDYKGGKDRPLKQFVHYVFDKEHDLPYLVIQARNAIISTLEVLDERHSTLVWFEGVQLPDAKAIAAKIKEHGGPGKLHTTWMQDRGAKNRKTKLDNARDDARRQREAFEARAAREGKTPKELGDEIKMAEDIKLLRDRMLLVQQRIPKMISLGLAVPTTITTPPSNNVGLFCSFQGTLYEIKLDEQFPVAAE